MMGLALAVVAFALGSIPFGVLVARARGVDIRQRGSGNIGATNVTRVLGATSGAIVLACDAGKGAIAIAVANYSLGDQRWQVVAAGFAAVLGHCFSPWLGGKGGKGVATALGVFAVLDPGRTAIATLVFGAVLGLTRVPALGSLAASATLTALWLASGSPPEAALACACSALLVYTHRTNLAQLTNRRRSR